VAEQAAPHSASTWVWWHQLDVQYLVIRLFELCGLASHVVVAPPHRLREGYSPDGLLARVVAQWTLSGLLVLLVWRLPSLCSCGAAHAARRRREGLREGATEEAMPIKASAAAEGERG
tara:strand:- start:597 stop:950 length:354 start_codon:yes stop_codon:yes gene_type:complete